MEKGSPEKDRPAGHAPPCGCLLLLGDQELKDSLPGALELSCVESFQELARSPLPADRPVMLLVDENRIALDQLQLWLREAEADVEVAALVVARDFRRLRALLSDRRCCHLFFVNGNRQRVIQHELCPFLAAASPPTAPAILRPPGAQELPIKSYEQRGEALSALESYAHAMDVGVTASTYISLMADELLMNAMYSTAVSDRRKRLEWMHGNPWTREPIEHEVALAFWAADDLFFIQVTDSLGKLDREKVVEALRRSQLFIRDQVDAEEGLGLVLAMNLCRRLTVRVAAGRLSEVSAALPVRQRSRDDLCRLNALHLIGL